jgi:hypothetical protein
MVNAQITSQWQRDLLLMEAIAIPFSFLYIVFPMHFLKSFAHAGVATVGLAAVAAAFMHVMGRWNWWAPKPLRWLHSRIGIDEEPRSLACGSGTERHSTISTTS